MRLMNHAHKGVSFNTWHEVTRDLHSGPLQGKYAEGTAARANYVRAGVETLDRAQLRYTARAAANSARITQVARSMASSSGVFARLGAVAARIVASAPALAAVALAVAAVAGIGYGLYQLFKPAQDAAKEAIHEDDKPEKPLPSIPEDEVAPDLPVTGPGPGFLRYYSRSGSVDIVHKFFSRFLSSLT